MDVRHKYAGLRFLALLINVVAWLVLIGSIALAIWFWIQGEKIAGLRYDGQNWTGIVLLPFGILTFVQLYIVGSLIMLFTSVEYNTRANATATARLIALVKKLEKQKESRVTSAIAPPPPPPPPPAPKAPVHPAPPPPPPPPPKKSEVASVISPPPAVEDATKTAKDAVATTDEVEKAEDEAAAPAVTQIMPPEGENPTA